MQNLPEKYVSRRKWFTAWKTIFLGHNFRAEGSWPAGCKSSAQGDVVKLILWVSFYCIFRKSNTFLFRSNKFLFLLTISYKSNPFLLKWNKFLFVGLNRTGHMSFLNGLDRTPIFAGPDWIRTYIFKHFTYQVQVIDSHKTQIWCQMILDQINKQKKILKKKNWKKKDPSCFRTVWENLPYFWTGSDIR